MLYAKFVQKKNKIKNGRIVTTLTLKNKSVCNVSAMKRRRGNKLIKCRGVCARVCVARASFN